MAEEAGEVEIAHSVSIRFDNGKPVQIPSALLVEENVAAMLRRKHRMILCSDPLC